MKTSRPDHPIAIETAAERVVVTLAGRKLADTSRALALREADYPVVFYIPREDVAMGRLTRSPHHTHCPYKGDASYFSAEGRENVAWSYEEPHPAVAAIREHLAFYPERVDTIELLIPETSP